MMANCVCPLGQAMVPSYLVKHWSNVAVKVFCRCGWHFQLGYYSKGDYIR